MHTHKPCESLGAVRLVMSRAALGLEVHKHRLRHGQQRMQLDIIGMEGSYAQPAAIPM